MIFNLLIKQSTRYSLTKTTKAEPIAETLHGFAFSHLIRVENDQSYSQLFVCQSLGREIGKIFFGIKLIVRKVGNQILYLW